MIERILPEELKLGMYIERGFREKIINGKKKVDYIYNILVDTEEKLQKLKNSQLRYIYINTEKSIEIKPEKPRVEKKPPPEPIIVKEEEEEEEEPPPPPVSFTEEIKKAKIIKEESVNLVKNYMEDVSLGKSLDSEKAKLQVKNIVDSLFRNADALISLTRLKSFDHYTFTHCVNVSVLLTSFAKKLGYNRKKLERLALGGLLHDIGKMKIPDKILNKPGRFTDEERQIMKNHTIYGKEILDRTEGIPEASKLIALEHHERYDGGGYPYGKDGSTLGQDSLIAAISDVYDALTSKRVYKPGMPPPQALAYIKERSNREFKKTLVDLFIINVGVYPVGSLVELSTGELGIIAEVNRDDLLKPFVLIITDKLKRFTKTRELISLYEFREKRIVGFPEPEKYKIDPNKILEESVKY